MRQVLWICEKPEEGMCSFIAKELQVIPARDLNGVLAYLTSRRPAAVFIDGSLEGWNSEEILEEIQRNDASIPVVIRDAEMRMADAVRLARRGAHQCLGRDVDPAHLVETLREAAEEGRRRERQLPGGPVSSEAWARFLVGTSPAIRRVGHVIQLVGGRRCTVLITGETGTGKEMAARALHEASPRGHLPLVAVNCGALPEHLLEAELFGYVKGAFTGAAGHRVGRFEQAHKSTVFLDEIGDMPLDLQVKLLRVLQERELQRLGSSETIHVDVRIIAASNANLLERIRQGRFRQDLYYRLNVVPLVMPPLRDRTSDIPLLVEHFIEKLCRLEGVPPKSASAEVLDLLCAHDWPGNVRELENAVEMAIALSGDRDRLYPSDFPLPSPARAKVVSIAKAPPPLPEDGLDFETAVSAFERSLLAQALDKAGGNKTVAADLLGLKRTTLLAKLRNLEARGALSLGA